MCTRQWWVKIARQCLASFKLSLFLWIFHQAQILKFYGVFFSRPVTTISPVTHCSWWGVRWRTSGTGSWEWMTGFVDCSQHLYAFTLSQSLSMSFLSFSCWQRGKFLMVRCPSDKEYGQWKLALESQTADNVKATYVRPVLSCPPHPQKVGVVISSQNSSFNVSPTSKHHGIPLIEFYIIKAGFTCAPGKHHVHVVPMTIHSKLVNVNIPPPLPPHPYPLWVTCRKR